MGHDKIKNVISVISTTLRIENEKIYSQILKKLEIILISDEDVNIVFDYLQSIGLTTEQIKETFFDAILLGKETLHGRCDFVLKHWGIDDLIYLISCGLFSNLPYYDFIEALSVSINTLGVEKAMEFFAFI